MRVLQDHGLAEITTCLHRNVCDEGFAVEDACDGVFLDLPAPWNAIDNAKRALSKARGGRLVSFSPCIEQVLFTEGNHSFSQKPRFFGSFQLRWAVFGGICCLIFELCVEISSEQGVC